MGGGSDGTSGTGNGRGAPVSPHPEDAPDLPGSSDDDYAAAASVAHNNLGCILRARGELRDAVAHLRAAADAAPTNWQARQNLGRCLRDLGELRAAAAEFEAVAGLQPMHAGAALELGATLAQVCHGVSRYGTVCNGMYYHDRARCSSSARRSRRDYRYAQWLSLPILTAHAIFYPRARRDARGGASSDENESCLARVRIGSPRRVLVAHGPPLPSSLSTLTTLTRRATQCIA